MDNQLSFLKKKALELFSLVVIIILVLQIPFIDILIFENTLTEISLTEFLQEFILAVITGIFIYLAFRRPDMRYGMILITGFFACMLIRELDFLFDNTPISWFYVAMAVALVCTILSIKNKESTIRGLVNFCQENSYAIIVCGLLAVLVFSRLVGMQALWRHLLGDFYIRIVKNTVEETTELFGYTLCLIASLKYARVALIENHDKKRCRNSIYGPQDCTDNRIVTHHEG